MTKKLAKLAEEGGESQLITTIRESAASIWLAGVGAYCRAQEEGGKLFDVLVKEGEAVENSASKTAQYAISGVRSTMTGTWDKLEQVFVDRVACALHSLNVATKHDIDALANRVAELSKATDKLAKAMDGTKVQFRAHKSGAVATRKPAARTQTRTHS